jgi:hypothetical protein
MHKSSLFRKPEIDAPLLEIEDLEHQNRQAKVLMFHRTLFFDWNYLRVKGTSPIFEEFETNSSVISLLSASS